MKKINGAVFPGTQGGPLMHVVAGKAVAFLEASKPEFKAYSAQVLKNATAMAETLVVRGYALVSGGTDNHLMLIDLSEHSCSGKDAEALLGEAGITVNKNTVPKEKRSPFVTSGVRVGTPAITTRGMGTDESIRIANWIADVLDQPENAELRAGIKSDIKALCQSFPVYPHLSGV